MKALILYHQDMEEGEALIPLDLLVRGGVRVTTLGMTRNPIVGAHGIVLQADLTFDTPVRSTFSQEYDLIVVPGGKYVLSPETNAQQIGALIQSFIDADKWVSCICAAPYFLNLTSLRDYAFTAFPDVVCKIQFGHYVDQDVVTSERLITGRSLGHAFAFGFALLQALAGAEVTNRIKRQICL